METLKTQLEDAKIEVTKGFPKESILKEKIERLSELNARLNMDESSNEIIAEEQKTPEVTNKNEIVPKFGTR